MPVEIKFQKVAASEVTAKHAALIVVGDKASLFPNNAFVALSDVPAASVLDFSAITQPLKAELTDKVSQYISAASDSPFLVTVALVKSDSTRHTGPIRSDLVPDIIAKSLPKSGNVVVKFVCTRAQVLPLSVAVSRAFSLYNKKTGKDQSAGSDRVVSVDFQVSDGGVVDLAELQRVSHGVRFAAELVDTPPSELHTDSYLDVVSKVHARLSSKGVKLTVIKGHELESQGFGGLWGVGKAAAHLPALAVLSYTPADSSYSSAWVGKGIVYDTGGLSIKGSTNMPTMKCDMGGSAAILAAFEAAVSGGYKHSLHALLCLAENSVDANSTRPDDILYMYSGKTVEVNNTDAEGRLVLADGVAYASKHLKPDVILDMATLTGAQMICTGEKHAAILTADEALEKAAYSAGQVSGDWVYPILYAPEILKKEFQSDVADMKNSVKSRMNAQSSCAGHFVEDHLDAEWKGKWIHVDIAGPAFPAARGSGFGVAFLLELLKQLKK
eukprot:Partr_v1_DN25547_c0_g1_i1_m20797 putative Aminopeptidase